MGYSQTEPHGPSRCTPPRCSELLSTEVGCSAPRSRDYYNGMSWYHPAYTPGRNVEVHHPPLLLSTMAGTTTLTLTLLFHHSGNYNINPHFSQRTADKTRLMTNILPKDGR